MTVLRTLQDLLDSRRWRRNLVAGLPGEVLELGVGTGQNLPFYRHATHVYAIEPDPERARQAAAQPGVTVPVTVKVAPAEALPFEDASFDHVVSSLVFCSVADPAQALAEVGRVLRPGGALHMLEHVRPTTPWLAGLFGALTPTWSRWEHNCHLDRATPALLDAAGWRVQVHRRVAMVVRLTAWPPPPA